MEINHLSDKEMQEYVSGEFLNSAAAEHLASCNHCQTQVAIYKSLFQSIIESEVPVLDFDLEEVVMQKIESTPASQKQLLRKVIIIYLIIVLITILSIWFASKYFNVLNNSSSLLTVLLMRYTLCYYSIN